MINKFSNNKSKEKNLITKKNKQKFMNKALKISYTLLITLSISLFGLNIDYITSKNTGNNNSIAFADVVDPITTIDDSKNYFSASQTWNLENSINKTDDSSSDETETKRAVTISITGKNGAVILAPTQEKITEGETVAKVLQSVCSQYNINLRSKGSGRTYYVKSIDGLGEKEDGSGSGWMVRVNGELIDVSAGVYKVKSKDIITWFYFSGEFNEIPKF